MAFQGFKIAVQFGGKLAKMAKVVSGADDDAIQRIFERWQRVYAAFIRRRFVNASRGDGTWPPLSPRTIASRRKGRGKRAKPGAKPAILRDTGLLFSQLHPTFDSIRIRGSGGGLKFTAGVNFGAEGSYPDGTRVVDVMSFHQAGKGRLPKREILVTPDKETHAKMMSIAKPILIEAFSRGE